MIKERRPYYWPIEKIVTEYALIQAKTSELPVAQRNAVESIYKQKLNKGLIPGQREALTAELNACFEAAKGALIQLCKALGVEDPQPEHLGKFHMLLDYSTGGEVANYLISIQGNFLGWIKVYKENNGYKAKYYVEEKEQSRAKEISHSSKKQ